MKGIKKRKLQTQQLLNTASAPFLVASSDHAILLPSKNSSDLALRITGAELVLYADAGHGGIFQYHDTFLAKAKPILTA